jgi:hypothetical protein
MHAQRSVWIVTTFVYAIRHPRAVVDTHHYRWPSDANITSVVQCGGSSISLDTARCGPRATIIRNVIRLLRVDTLGACVAVAIRIKRFAVRANAVGMNAIAFLVLSTIWSSVDASVGEFNTLGTGKPQLYGIITADTHGLIIGTTLIRNPICHFVIDTQGTEETVVIGRDLATDIANADWFFHERSTTLVQSIVIFSVKAVARRKPPIVIAGGTVARYHGNSDAQSGLAVIRTCFGASSRGTWIAVLTRRRVGLGNQFACSSDRIARGRVALIAGGDASGNIAIRSAHGTANITSIVQCRGSSISLDTARCDPRATIIRNVVRLLRVDTLGACVTVAIRIKRFAVRADAAGMIAVAFLVLSTVRSIVDASVGELDALGTGKPQL